MHGPLMAVRCSHVVDHLQWEYEGATWLCGAERALCRIVELPMLYCSEVCCVLPLVCMLVVQLAATMRSVLNS